MPSRRDDLFIRVTCKFVALIALLLTAVTATSAADDDGGASKQPVDTTRGDRMVAEYFRGETETLAAASLDDIETLADWENRRGEYRRQLFEMLGLDPLPEKTPLEPVVTGTVEEDEFRVEKVQFQSRPGLYVTGNFYIPKNLEGTAPAILYVCGHGQVKKDGVSYGNKVHYHHHGSWFARNGYVCLTIDTLQLGEIEGLHHGTHREGMWWWNARGYTPAGVEAWNCIRALDYLESRPEVDADRIGVTGRSGGGAYSWWISALDERIKVAVPVAGITNLDNHVVDGCVEGHCDCMFQVNTYRWDFPVVAALVAPRPLLISNTDKDSIFPLDGVVDVYTKVRPIYELYGKPGNIGLNIAEGPHQDTQELRINAFHWLNRFLKDDDPLIETTAVKFFEPEQLKVFDTLPDDQRNTEIHESFTERAADPSVPQTADEWNQQRSAWMEALEQKSFRGWPAKDEQPPLDVEPVFEAQYKSVLLRAYDFTSQENVRLRLYVAQPAATETADLDLVVLNVLDDEGWREFLQTMRVGFADVLADEQAVEPDAEAFGTLEQMFERFGWGMAYVAPRGVGPTEWTRDERERTHIRRRFMLLGQTLDGMRVWDAVRGAEALRSVDGAAEVPLWMQGEREMAGIALYASLFVPDVARLDLWQLSDSHRKGPTFLNVLRYLDVPQAVAMAAEKSPIRIYDTDADKWSYPRSVADALGWDEEQIQVRSAEPSEPATSGEGK